MNAQTRVSAKGQIVIPKNVRDRLHWTQGQALDVIETPQGVLLQAPETGKSGKSFEEITARIRARIKYDGPPVSIEEMNQSIEEMWKQGGPRWDD